jgi:hypothetical protein
MAENGDRRRWIMAILGALVVAAIVAAVVIAVGGDDDSSTATSGTTTTVASPTTSLASTPSSTTAPVVPPVPILIPSKNDGSSPDGSGCAPPNGETLPDGIWFGDLKAVDSAAGTISLDLNCFFTGQAAAKANQQDNGGAGDPVDNDYYIRNKVKRVYTLRAVSNVAVLELTAMGGGPLGAAQSGLNAASASLNHFNNLWIGWIQVSGGQVVVIQQQFVP